MRVIGVLNRDGGALKTTDLDALATRAAGIFRAQGHELEVRVVGGSELMAELKRAAGEAELLLAGGGDGTISAAAAVAFERGVPLAVLPAGTMNLFARSLGIPLALDAALQALAAGSVCPADIATVNGRPFVHQVSVGIHPKLVKLRDALSYRTKVGKMIASGRAALGVMFNPPSFVAEIRTAHGLERRRLAGISISNNPLDEGHLPIPDRLDRGLLGIYLVKTLTLRAMLQLAFGLLRGKFRSLPQIVDKEAQEATVRFPLKKRGALAALDGELIPLPDQMVFKIEPGALRVVIPRQPQTEGAVASMATAPA
jgi:diacylglycerol kinase family enzyme